MRWETRIIGCVSVSILYLNASGSVAFHRRLECPDKCPGGLVFHFAGIFAFVNHRCLVNWDLHPG